MLLGIQGGPVKVFDMNWFMNAMLEWKFDWTAIDAPDDEIGVLWRHHQSDSPVLLQEDDADGYSSEEGSRPSLSIGRYQ